MTTTTFDTLGYFERLKAAGVPEPQAKVQASALQEFVDNTLATKHDLKELELTLKNDITAAEVRILRWMTGGFLTQTALIITVLALMR